MNALLSPVLTDAFRSGFRVADASERIILKDPTSAWGATYRDAQPAEWQLTTSEWSQMFDALNALFDFIAAIGPDQNGPDSPLHVLADDGRILAVEEDVTAYDLLNDLIRSRRPAELEGVTLTRRNADGSSTSLYPLETDGVVAFAGDAELFCAHHGSFLSDPELPSPILDQGNDLAPVEWCGAFSETDHGHSFCTVCGDHLIGAGHPDSTFIGPFSHCENCNTWAVLVDGENYVYVNDLASLEGLVVTVKGVTVTYVTDLQGVTPVTGVVDALTYRWTLRSGVKAYVAFLDADPSAGRFLVFACSWDAAYDDALEAFEDACENDDPAVSDDEHQTFIRESLQLVDVDLNAVTVERP